MLLLIFKAMIIFQFPLLMIKRVQKLPKAVLLSRIYTLRSSHQKCSVKWGVLKNLAKFTGKHKCQNLFFDNNSPDSWFYIFPIYRRLMTIYPTLLTPLLNHLAITLATSTSLSIIVKMFSMPPLVRNSLILAAILKHLFPQ